MKADYHLHQDIEKNLIIYFLCEVTKGSHQQPQQKLTGFK